MSTATSKRSGFPSQGVSTNVIPLNAALRYAAAGMEVFPCHHIEPDGGCSCRNPECGCNSGKHPRTLHGLQHATTNAAQIRKWWRKWPNANIAWRPSPGFAVIDCDEGLRNGMLKVGLSETLKALEAEYEPVARVLTQKSGGGGLHIVCKVPEGVEVNGAPAKDIEVKSHSGYIMVEPSNHLSGKPYRWDDWPDAILLDCVPFLPEWAWAGSRESEKAVKEPLGYEIDDVRSAVMAIPNEGKFDERAEWLKIVAAIHHETEGSEEGRAIAHEWSSEHSTYNEAHTDHVWDSFRMDRQGVTFATVLDAAKRNGWQEPIDFDPVPDDEPSGEDTRGNTFAKLNIVCAADVEPEPVEWLWKGRIARGKITLLGGDPGMGKSQVSIDIAARITTGSEWPDGGRAPLGSVVILSAEDAVADTIVPRLMAAGGERSRVHVVKSVLGKRGKSRTFSLQEDLTALGEAVTRLGDVALVIVDPITAYMGENVDSHKNADVRAVLAGVSEWAERFRIAIFAITHPPKAAQAKAINSFTGSLAYGAAPRLAFMTAEDPNDEARKLLLYVKGNIGKKAAGLGYRIVSWDGMPDISRIEWDTLPVNMTANDVVRESRDTGKRRVVASAEIFLRNELGFGPQPETVIKEKATAEGISEATLRRAKKELGVISKRSGYGREGVWMWSMEDSGEELI